MESMANNNAAIKADEIVSRGLAEADKIIAEMDAEEAAAAE